MIQQKTFYSLFVFWGLENHDGEENGDTIIRSNIFLINFKKIEKIPDSRKFAREPQFSNSFETEKICFNRKLEPVFLLLRKTPWIVQDYLKANRMNGLLRYSNSLSIPGQIFFEIRRYFSKTASNSADITAVIINFTDAILS